MSETARTPQDYPRVSSTEPDPGTSAWVGWILFAGVMLILVGIFQAMAGLVALFDHNYYVVASGHLVVRLDYTGWGWVHLFLGLLAVIAGYGVMSGKLWARIYGIVLASVSAVANLAFLAADPVWAVIMITVDVLVIFSLAVHGSEARSAARADG
jgi:hypothetical protein